MSMTPDERNLLLLLARMVLQTRAHHALPRFDESLDRRLQEQITRIEAAEDRAADEEAHLGRG